MENKLSQVKNRSIQIRDKSSQIENMSIIHIKKTLIFLPIPKALITDMYFCLKQDKDTPQKNKLSQVRNK